MASEEDEKDLELKDLIVQTLDANGILAKLKAQIRANVFVALDENEKRNESKFIKNENQVLNNLCQTKEGRLAINLVRDFLEVCKLRYTLSVFDPEIDVTRDGTLIDSRSSLLKSFNIENDSKSTQPVLCSLLNAKMDNQTGNIGKQDNVIILPNELSRVSLVEAKKKFDFYDKDRNGLIDRNELRTLFCDLYPNFNRNMIERYVNDEFNVTDRNFSNGIDFNEFKSMYQRLFSMCRSFIVHDFGSISNEKIHQDLDNSSEDEDMLLVSEITRSDLTESFKRSQNLDSSSNQIDMKKLKSKNKITDVDISDELSSSSSSTSFSANTTDKRKKLVENTTPRDTSSRSNNLLDVINAERSNAEAFKRPRESKLKDFDERKSSSSDREEALKQNSVSSVSSIVSNNGKGFLKDAPSLFSKKTSNLTGLKDIDKRIKNVDLDDENYDDDFTSGTTPRTGSINDKRRGQKSRLQTTSRSQQHEQQQHQQVASDDEIDENILSYADESSKFDDITNDKSISTVQGNHDADYLEDLSI